MCSYNHSGHRIKKKPVYATYKSESGVGHTFCHNIDDMKAINYMNEVVLTLTSIMRIKTEFFWGQLWITIATRLYKIL